MKVKELTVEQFKGLIQEAIEEKLEELVGDPDLGLELREEIEERLHSSLAARQNGQKGVPIDEVARQAGLDW
jgi:signal recognition particle GTPase